jgi:curved DNA-binding protein CbpA
MAAADKGRPVPDLYQLLGVPREASREEIALACRRRARAEHPDARPADAAAPGRFRDLAEAWQERGDPVRRAAYDRAPARDQQPATRIPAAGARVPVRRPTGRGDGGPLARMPEPPLRAGPVRVEGPSQESPAGGRDEEDIRLAVLAGLVLRYLARDRGRPW